MERSPLLYEEVIMKVAILGSTGMNGHVIKDHFLKHYGEDDVRYSTRRTPTTLNSPPGEFFFEIITHPRDYYLHGIPKCKYVINCIGLIKPHVPEHMEMAVMANALFPHHLANFCEEHDMKLINITTDCVYSGKKGHYTEDDEHDALDAYGKTKSLGEPKNCMNLRTSIIGPELYDRATSLVEIIKRSAGGDFNAYTNWFWSGVTTLQYAKICAQIMDEDLYEQGTFHVFSDPIIKGDLVKVLNAKYDLNLNITECEAPYFCDRTLSTVKDLNGKLDIPSIRNQIREM